MRQSNMDEYLQPGVKEEVQGDSQKYKKYCSREGGGRANYMQTLSLLQ